ncbi:MAG: FkbM family methyltransferase [Betaproteobacteria bacterium]|nr:MAG: FkbM family methyltransferase [Betaproteobacteria bacterium]
MPSWLQHKIRRHPRIRECLLPWWLGYLDLRWRLICASRRPVLYRAGNVTVRLHPEGQIAEQLWKGNFESLERNFVEAYLKPGMRVVNVGANVGLYVVMASTLVGHEGEVHAFEPSATTYARLIRNLELNRCRNVSANRAALSSASGKLFLRADPMHPSYDGHRFVERIEAVDHPLDSDELVEALTLDDYFGSLRPRELSTVELMIVDVEGAELAVLQGARAILAQKELTLLLECTKHQDAVESFLAELGYRFWSWNDERRRLEPARFREQAKRHDVIVRRSAWEAPRQWQAQS